MADDSRAEINPDAEDTATSVVDRNCDGVPGVDADRDGVPSLATQGTDCDDSDPGVTGSWPGWTGVPMRFTGIDAGVAVNLSRGNTVLRLPLGPQARPQYRGPFTEIPTATLMGGAKRDLTAPAAVDDLWNRRILRPIRPWRQRDHGT